MAEKKYVLMSEYEILKNNYDIISKSNKDLSSIIESMNDSMEKFNSNYESILNMYNSLPKLEEIKKLINTRKSIQIDQKTIQFTINSSISESDKALTKALDNMKEEEITYINKIKLLEKNLTNISLDHAEINTKYLQIQKEKENTDATILIMQRDLSDLKTINSNLNEDIKSKELEVNRLKEKEKRMIEEISNNNKFHDNQENLLKITMAESLRQSNYSLDPTPSFIKFLNKKNSEYD